MNRALQVFLSLAVATGSIALGIVVATGLINTFPAVPPIAKTVPAHKLPTAKVIKSKVKSITTPKSSLTTSLAPARDLRGIWQSALRGKGIQVYGQLNTPGAATTIYENGDIKLTISGMNGNSAVGEICYTNMCATVNVAMAQLGTRSMTQCGQAGCSPVTIRVSSSALDFGTVRSGDDTFVMRGNYTTDIMSGTMTMTMPAYGVLKGEFHLIRQ